MPERSPTIQPHYGLQKYILHCIPPQAVLLREALRNFWSLKITLDFRTITKRIKDPDYIRAIPLFRNNIIKLKTRLLTTWSRLNCDTVGSLFHPITGEPLTRPQVIAHLHKEDPSIHRTHIYSLANHVMRYQSHIPDEVGNFLTQPRRYVDREVVYFTSDVEGDKYAVLRAPNAHTHVKT